MPLEKEKLKQKVIEAIKTCYDPEIPVNVYELGLIYETKVDEEGRVFIKMTLTSPACPVAEALPMEVQQKIFSVDGVKDVDLQLVWDPPWNKDKMSEEAKFALDMF